MTLHKYTQAEFDALPVFDGRKQCPTGDYTAIKAFGERCSFGERCRFGAGCSFGERCSFGEGCRFGAGCSFEDGKTPRTANPYMAFDRIGSENRKAYFFDFTDGVFIRAGCFFGSEAEFVAKLERDDDAAKTAEYMAALALAKMRFARAIEAKK
jgi:hypothetical protein